MSPRAHLARALDEAGVAYSPAELDALEDRLGQAAEVRPAAAALPTGRVRLQFIVPALAALLAGVAAEAAVIGLAVGGLVEVTPMMVACLAFIVVFSIGTAGLLLAANVVQGKSLS